MTASDPRSSSGHLLLLTGVGGHTPAEAMASLRTITRTLSVLHLAAWTPGEQVREAWQREDFEGEYLVAPDLENASEEAMSLHGRRPLHGVVTYSELLLQLQARVAAACGLPGNSVEAVALAQSKAAQRERFRAAGVPAPRAVRLFPGQQPGPELLASVGGLPAVLKPSLGAGSVGVQLVPTAEDLRRATSDLWGRNPVFLQRDDALLLEEHLPLEGVPGQPYADYVSVESIVLNGEVRHLAVTDRLRLTCGFAEEGLVLPTRLPEDQVAELYETASHAIAALGLTHGGVHTEIATTAGGPWVIEVNARAGGPVPAMFEAAAAYDYAADIGRAALGGPVHGRADLTQASVHRFIPIPPGDWRIAHQSEHDAVLRTFPELRYLAPRFTVGQAVNRRLTLHLASFMVQGNDLAGALRTAQRVEEVLALRLEPA